MIRSRPNAPGLRLEEITCQIGLARTLLLIRGYASEEARAALQRTIALIESAGALDEPLEHRLALFAALHGFWLASVAASSGAATRELAAECLQLAQKGGGQGERVAGHHAVGLSLMFSGDVLAARAHFDQAIAMFDPSEDRQATRYGGEYWSSSFAGRAATLWTLGYPDAARADAEASLESARAFGHAMTLGNNLIFAAWTNFACGNFEIAGSRSAELPRSRTRKKASRSTRAFSLMMERPPSRSPKAGARTRRRKPRPPSPPIARPEQTSDHGGHLLSSYLAEALAREGRFEEAQRLLDEAAVTMAATEERWCKSDIGRIAGEVALMGPARALASGGAPFRAGACDRAGAAGEIVGAARGDEPGQLRRDGGRHAEARACLEPVYRWFTEGFDAYDLIEAGTLLGELAD